MTRTDLLAATKRLLSLLSEDYKNKDETIPTELIIPLIYLNNNYTGSTFFLKSYNPTQEESKEDLIKIICYLESSRTKSTSMEFYEQNFIKIQAVLDNTQTFYTPLLKILRIHADCITQKKELLSLDTLLEIVNNNDYYYNVI